MSGPVRDVTGPRSLELLRTLVRAEDRWLVQARERLEGAAVRRGDARPRPERGPR